MKREFRKGSEALVTDSSGLKETRMMKAIVWTLLVFLCLMIASIVVLSLVPPVSKDALTHHLAVPKLYLKHGGIYEIPDILFSYYPMNLNLLYIIPLYFGNDIIPKFIHFSFALLTAGLIFFYLKKRINALYALLGMLFFLSTPIIIALSITVYVDLGLIFFSTASLLCLFKWAESHFKMKYLCFSAVCCGLALGTKYNGMITLFLTALFVPFIYLRSIANRDDLARDRQANSIKPNRYKRQPLSQLKSMGYAMVFVTVSLAVFSPWMIRNTIWTNNPLYPLYDSYFNPPESKSYAKIVMDRGFATSASAKNLNHFSLRSLIYGEPWWRIALIPIRIFFEGRDGTPQYFDGKLNPLLFFLPFFAFFHSERDILLLRAEKKMLAVFSILFILLVLFLIDMRIRWVGPAIPPLIILSVFGLHNIFAWIRNNSSERMKKICTTLVTLIVILLIGLNVNYLMDQFRIVDPASYISGRVGRDDYIDRFRKEYPVVQFANDNLPEDAKILCLFLGKRRYYSDREMVFDEGFFLDILRRSKSSEQILFSLGKRGITHLFIRYDLFKQWQIDNFDTRENRIFADFFHNYVNLLFSKNNYGLFELINVH